jgi:Alcohol dehydrogenase GroES-like domain
MPRNPAAVWSAQSPSEPRLRHSRKSKVPLLGQFGVGRPFRFATFCGRDQVGRGAGVKAVVYDRYGSPDLLRVEEVPVPAPAAGQVRVKIAATSVNLSDWECLRGSPAYARIGGLRFPACRTLGSDIAGLVDDVGKGVTRFRPGDAVYGDNLRLKGGFAEYTLAPESALAHKPAQLSFVEASTIPQAGAIALQGTKRAVTGHRVLINGAGGGRDPSRFSSQSGSVLTSPVSTTPPSWTSCGRSARIR